MIKYQLICDSTHEFEGWFQTSAAFEKQSQAGLITCPICDSAKVRRALMTPNLASPKRRLTSPESTSPNSKTAVPAVSTAKAGAAEIGEAMAQLRQLQRKIKSQSRDVGTEFLAEARKIHNGEIAPENIYGQSTDEEREALADEGIDVLTMPWLPPEH